MINAPVTDEKLEKWKNLFDCFAASMSPNRKTGEDVDSYFRSKYEYSILKSARWESVVKANITENDFFRDKLPQGAQPQIKSYSVDGVMVGIETLSGYFQVESEDLGKMASIYDDLFAYRGLDCDDLKNFVLVGQYLELTRKQDDNQ